MRSTVCEYFGETEMISFEKYNEKFIFDLTGKQNTNSIYSESYI